MQLLDFIFFVLVKYILYNPEGYTACVLMERRL